MARSIKEELEFILEALKESEINPENYDFGPAFALAKDRHKQAIEKVKKLIKEAKSDGH